MSRLVTALCVTALAATAQAQYGRKVHRMEINNGLTQSVRYFGTGLTPGESATLRDLERLENESYYARGLLDLKKQYVSSERILEPRRRDVQMDLYGVDVTQSNYLAAGGYGYYDRPTLYPGFTYTNYASPMFGTLASASRTVNYSLANGVGSEGAVKDAMSRVLAQQATPEYAVALERAFDRVALRAAASPTLRVALGLPAPAETREERGRIRAAVGEEDEVSGPVTLTLKSGEKLVGKKMTEEKDWIILDLPKGGRTRVRASEVVRIDEKDSGSGIRPAKD